MMKTELTYKNLLHRLKREWSDFRHVLNTEDKIYFDNLINNAEKYAEEANHFNPASTMTTVFMTMLLNQEKKINLLQNKVHTLKDDA